jgi:hypothetical protein
VSLALIALVVAGNVTASYFLPRYGDALAGVALVGAVSGPVLRAAGLADARLTPGNDTAVSGGHRLQLVTAYADSDRTVFFIEIDGQPLQVSSKVPPAAGALAISDVHVSDQFGHHYPHLAGVYSPYDPIEVEPLAWPASAEGGRLTIQVDSLGDYSPGPHQLLSGSWTLRVTLFQQTAQALALPASGSIGATHYAFTGVHLSSSLLQVHIHVSGDAVNNLERVAASRPTDAAGQRARGEEIGRTMRYFATKLIGPDGSVVSPRSWDAGGGEINSTYAGVGPGTYHLVVGDSTVGFYDSTLVVPMK